MARKTQIEIDLEGDKAIKALTDINNKLEDINDTAKDGKKSLGNLEKATQGIKKGFNAIGVAIKAAGIGLVLKAMDLLFDVFKQNQAVVDAMAVGFETVSIVFNELVQAIVDTVTKVNELTGGFDATKRIIVNLLKIALTPLKLSFFAIKLAVQEAQLIWEKSFFGDGDPKAIEQLNKGIEETKQSILDAGKGAIQAGKDIGTDFVEAVGEIKTLGEVAIKELSDVSIESALENAKANVALAKAAEKASAQQALLQAQFEKDAEKQRQIRDDVNSSIEERIKANNELNKVLEKQQEAQKKEAKTILDAAQAQFDKNGKDANAIKLLEAKTNLAQIENDITGKQSEQLVNEIALKNELLALSQSEIESKTRLAKELRDFEAEQEENELVRLEMRRQNLEAEKEIELSRLQDVIDTANAGTQAKVDAQIAYNEKFQELSMEEVRITKQTADAKRKIDMETTQASLAAAGLAFSSLEQLAGDNFEAQKTFQIANAVVSTIMGAIQAYNGAQTIPVVGPAVGVVLAALVAATGAANIAKIAATKPGGSASASFSGRSGPSTTPAAPSLSLVSPASAGESEIAGQIAGQNTNPSKAYVVSGEVTDQQALDRRIEGQATI